jgi:hypothetical protein
MSAKFNDGQPKDTPTWGPCPPPAPRTPPIAYRTPPHTISAISKPIPWPPSGARFPGDRIPWIPIQLSHSASANEDEIPNLVNHKALISEMDSQTTLKPESVMVDFLRTDSAAEVDGGDRDVFATPPSSADHDWKGGQHLGADD